jgi:sensor histidine kinase YesM
MITKDKIRKATRTVFATIIPCVFWMLPTLFLIIVITSERITSVIYDAAHIVSRVLRLTIVSAAQVVEFSMTSEIVQNLIGNVKF